MYIIIASAVPTTAPNAVSISNFSQVISDNWPIVSGIISFLVFALAGLWTLRKDLKNEIISYITQDDFLRKLAALSRPFLVFDERTSVLSDHGASAFIKEGGIHIKAGTPMASGRSLPVEICIEFKRHLPTPPLLSALYSDVVLITPKRGKHHDWIFELDYEMSGDTAQNTTRAYRLEIF